MTNVSIVPADKKNKEELLVEGRGDVDAHDNSNDDDDTKKNSSMTIICDAGYGFPRAKRPRRERIGAVSRQLYNYLIWKKQQSPPQQSSQPSIVNNNDVHLHMMGSMEDWKCIQDRIQELLLSTTTNNTGNNSTTDSINNNNNNNNNNNIEYLCPLAFPKMIQSNNNNNNNSNSRKKKKMRVCYLSPDADNVLSLEDGPPDVVIVGMLVDRLTQLNRSKERSLDIDENIYCARLPLHTIGASDLSSNEPLNIDTVLELITRWHWNFVGGKKEETAFRMATLYAMATHRKRHPNRTLHNNEQQLFSSNNQS
uniref:SAM-dependent MTase TRM10-type domain-containing protein n=1 Tax=Eucampia antarctica TaxID=49252 RepID=A0A7S2RSB4_9STRA|mmetsp:Transcript_26164/g.25011  ORF Transcript_26164/g.25011 Transcript_26164/m.25011 type:complete len:310 (+) Transcript_26164:307-1236(+)